MRKITFGKAAKKPKKKPAKKQPLIVSDPSGPNKFKLSAKGKKLVKQARREEEIRRTIKREEEAAAKVKRPAPKPIPRPPVPKAGSVTGRMVGPNTTEITPAKLVVFAARHRMLQDLAFWAKPLEGEAFDCERVINSQNRFHNYARQHGVVDDGFYADNLKATQAELIEQVLDIALQRVNGPT